MTADEQRKREFPIHSDDRRRVAGCPRAVPWDFVAPHEKQAKLNHDQSLERLAQRGGLGLAELLAVLEGRPWRSVATVSDEDALCRVQGLLALWRQPDGDEQRKHDIAAARACIASRGDTWLEDTIGNIADMLATTRREALEQSAVLKLIKRLEFARLDVTSHGYRVELTTSYLDFNGDTIEAACAAALAWLEANDG